MKPNPPLSLDDIPGLKVTVMGLGLHGGGLATARFFASLGADVLVTDLRREEQLSSSIESLGALPVRLVLGEHREEDFLSADLVIKNPAVPPDSPFLALAPRVSNDIAVYLGLTRRPVLAVTGTKGKSTTVSAVHRVLQAADPEADLGGNITVSPLSFLLKQIDEGRLSEPDAPVVLELSSWQLADCLPREVLKPDYSMITNIMHDHQNRYARFEDYVDDKRLIFQNQGADGVSVFNYDDPYGRSFGRESRARVLYFSSAPLPDGCDGCYQAGSGDPTGLLRLDGREEELLPAELTLPGEHNRRNLLAAACMLAAAGVDRRLIADELAAYAGIPHRLEKVAEHRGVSYYNDSAATIPQATAAAVASFDRPVHLIAGGTNKELDFTGLAQAFRNLAGLYLLEGSATPYFQEAALEAGIARRDPYDSLAEALEAASRRAKAGEIVLLSPGCASFGMFKNEFDRGDQFRELARALF